MNEAAGPCALSCSLQDSLLTLTLPQVLVQDCWAHHAGRFMLPCSLSMTHGKCCAGTNFLVRCKAVREAGWSPQYTMTEDFALGMEMKKAQWHCRYVQAYLAIGEAPDQIRNCFQQRSRWTKACS